MSWLIVPVTVILLRGALLVLILAGAETIWEDCLSARVRRALWILCIFLMMAPQPQTAYQPFAIDLTGYRDQVVSVADILPRTIALQVKHFEFACKFRNYSKALTGLDYQNYPYLLGLILAIVPALLLQAGSYLRCRKRIKNYKTVTDERICRIWKNVTGSSGRTPLLLDSCEKLHPPVLFGFFRQRLLLPVKQLKTLTDSELTLLLTHEYIHYRSFDGIINIFTLFLWPFCWYNPFFLAARRRLRINCELACDAKVLKKFPEKTAEYGKLLLFFANTEKPPEVTLAFREYAGELQKRIIYMTNLPQRKKSSRWASFGLALVIAAPFALFSTVTREPVKELPAKAVFSSAFSAGYAELELHPLSAQKNDRFTLYFFSEDWSKTVELPSGRRRVRFVFSETEKKDVAQSEHCLTIFLPPELAPAKEIKSKTFPLLRDAAELYTVREGISVFFAAEKN